MRAHPTYCAEIALAHGESSGRAVTATNLELLKERSAAAAISSARQHRSGSGSLPIK